MSQPITLLQAIGEIIRPSLLQRGGAIHLEETGEKSTCAPIKITKHGPAVVLKPDADASAVCPTCRAPLASTVNDRIFGLFNVKDPGLTTSCDYIIFYREEEEEDPPLFVFLCELKSKQTAGAGRQAENGRLLADHILAMAQHHRRVRLPERVYYRGLIFSTKYQSIPKGRLDTTKWSYVHGSPRMADVGFAYLPCGASYPISHFCA